MCNNTSGTETEKLALLELLFRAIRFKQPGGRWQGLMPAKGMSPGVWVGGIGFTFYIDFGLLRESAATLLRTYYDELCGHSHEQLCSLLTKFFESIMGDVPFGHFLFAGDAECVAQVVGDGIYFELVPVLDKYIKESCAKSLFLMPITDLPCPKTPYLMKYAWVPGDYVLMNLLDHFGVVSPFPLNSYFPPHEQRFLYPMTNNDSWFACLASTVEQAECTFRRMAGALSVVIGYPRNKLISGARRTGGLCGFSDDGKHVTSYDKACSVPPLLVPVELPSDASVVMERVLETSATNLRVQVGLECLADSWTRRARMAFIHDAIAIDALFGEDGKVKASILKGLTTHVKYLANVEERFSLLYKLRNELLHGSQAAIETSPSYSVYLSAFSTDPASDQVRMLHECVLSVCGCHRTPGR